MLMSRGEKQGMMSDLCDDLPDVRSETAHVPLILIIACQIGQPDERTLISRWPSPYM